MVGLARELERAFLGERSPPVAERLGSDAMRSRDIGSDCPSCGAPVGPGEARPGPGGSVRCAACRDTRLVWDAFFRLASHEGAWREAIHETKFARHRHLGHALGARLGERILQGLRSSSIDPRRAIICPMPTTFRRRLSRGIDHAGVLARGAGWSSGLPVEQFLTRKHRPSQLDVPASRRNRNVAGAFRPRLGGLGRLLGRMGEGPAVIVVIDDVRTTGATMRGACRALRAGLRSGLGPSKRGGRAGPDRATVMVWAAVVATAEAGDAPPADRYAPEPQIGL